jgi:hypothetical protein
MSLFQSREWWSHRIDADEEFDGGGMVVGNVDNDPSGAGVSASRALRVGVRTTVVGVLPPPLCLCTPR